MPPLGPPGSASAQPKRSARSPLLGEHSDFCRNTFKAPHSIFTQHTTSYDVVMVLPAQGSKEATPSSSEGASSDVTIHIGREGGKRRRK
jgi:hypothetical protein